MKDFTDRLLFLLACPIIALFSLLPPGWAVRIGKWLGRIAFLVDARHRNISLTNLEAAFPDLSASERRTIARKAFENLGKTLLEIPGLARQKPEDIQRRVRYVGPARQEWIRAQQEGGVLLLTGHIGNWELGACALAAQRRAAARWGGGGATASAGSMPGRAGSGDLSGQQDPSGVLALMQVSAAGTLPGTGRYVK